MFVPAKPAPPCAPGLFPPVAAVVGVVGFGSPPCVPVPVSAPADPPPPFVSTRAPVAMIGCAEYSTIMPPDPPPLPPAFVVPPCAPDPDALIAPLDVKTSALAAM